MLFRSVLREVRRERDDPRVGGSTHDLRSTLGSLQVVARPHQRVHLPDGVLLKESGEKLRPERSRRARKDYDGAVAWGRSEGGGRNLETSILGDKGEHLFAGGERHDRVAGGKGYDILRESVRE